MPDPPLIEQEFVAHVFAPVEGPMAARALGQVEAMWAACRDRFGMTGLIPGVGLPTELPQDWQTGPASRPLAAREHPGAPYQAILRREHDVLNLSVVFGVRHDAASRTRPRWRRGSPARPRWVEFDQWWNEIVAAADMNALLGVARLYQAKARAGRTVCIPDGVTTVLRETLPPSEQDDGWWDRGLAVTGGLTIWDLSPRQDASAQRRLVIVAPSDRDPQLSAFTWSRGDPALPPLARYLMHSAKIRYQLSVLAGGQPYLEEIRRHLADHVVELQHMLQQSAQTAIADRPEPAGAHPLWADRAAVVVTLASLREMRHAAHIAAANMAGAVQAHIHMPSDQNLLTEDQALADWLTQQLDDAITTLGIADDAARQITDSIPVLGRRFEPADAETQPMRAHQAQSTAPARTLIRMGFTIDVAEYSGRPALAKVNAQRRVLAIVTEVLADLGLDLADTDHQDTGDGMNVFLPAHVEIHRALPHLIRATTEWLARDNQECRDHLRLRMAAAIGPFGQAPLGFAGNTIIECARLVDSQPLRDALTQHPNADLAVMISDVLHTFVLGEGQPGLNADEFQPVDVTVKTYHKKAWLWAHPMQSRRS